MGKNIRDEFIPMMLPTFCCGDPLEIPGRYHGYASKKK